MATCKYCQKEIQWIRGFGNKWIPNNMDGTYHKCPKLNYMRPVQVHCGKCKKFMDEGTVTFRNIEEDIFGHDVLTFDCPICGTRQKSHRLG
jgi:hypothetical protein